MKRRELIDGELSQTLKKELDKCNNATTLIKETFKNTRLDEFQEFIKERNQPSTQLKEFCSAMEESKKRLKEIFKTDTIIPSLLDNNVLNTKRLRGFEFVSMEQGLKDFDEASIFDCELKSPKRGTCKSAGYDIFAPYDITLQPNEEINIPTGLKAYMQDGEVLMAFPRSGLGFKYYCRLANTVGIIDGDYFNNPKNEGHMFVKIRNEGTKEMTIERGDGMCQMIFMPFLLVDGDSFNEGETRQGGFGSTTK